MARILIAWELGGGLGHALPLRAVAVALLAQGHQVVVAARDLPRVERAFAGLPVTLLAAPFFPGLATPARQQSSLADVLWFDAGGHSVETLGAAWFAWRALLAELRIELLIADAAPVALAAARGQVCSLAYDSYFHATDAAAWGIFRDWERIDAAACELRAVHLLAHLNAVRESAGLPPVPDLAAGFGASVHFIRNLPELDYAGPRVGVRYVRASQPAGAAPAWPAVSGQARRIFAYLRKDYPPVDRVIHALARLQQAAVICFHDGIAPEKLRRADHVRYETTSLDLNLLLPQVDAVIGHGGGLQTCATLHGKPALLFPMHTEQYLSGRMAERAGVALLHLDTGDRPDFLPLIRRLLGEPGLARQAQALAASARERIPDAVASVLLAVQELFDGALPARDRTAFTAIDGACAQFR